MNRDNLITNLYQAKKAKDKANKAYDKAVSDLLESIDTMQKYEWNFEKFKVTYSPYEENVPDTKGMWDFLNSLGLFKEDFYKPEKTLYPRKGLKITEKKTEAEA